MAGPPRWLAIRELLEGQPSLTFALGHSDAMSVLLANVAVPILFPHPFVAVIALVPVVGLEALMLRKRVGVTLYQVFAANVLSALWGVPLAFACIFLLGAGLELFIDANDGSLLRVVLVFLAVVLPCFVLSVLLEGRYLRVRTNGEARASDRAFWFAVIRAHCYSYLLLLGLDCLWIRMKLW
jgi:hypothetical protein